MSPTSVAGTPKLGFPFLFPKVRHQAAGLEVRQLGLEPAICYGMVALRVDARMVAPIIYLFLDYFELEVTSKF